MSRLDDAIDAGFDPHNPISGPSQDDRNAFEASPWRAALDASVAQANRLRNSGPVELTAAEQQWLDAEHARELADRDREWWAE
jgi:hypothetical protein